MFSIAAEPRFWWWEIFECFRKLFLSAVVGFIFPGSVSQVGVAMLAVLLVVIVYARFSPYSDKTQDAMQLTCQVLMFLVLFFSILIKAQAGEEAKGVDSTEFTEKCIIFCSIMPLVILVAQVYTNVVQPMWQVMHAKDKAEQAEKKAGGGAQEAEMATPRSGAVTKPHRKLML